MFVSINNISDFNMLLKTVYNGTLHILHAFYSTQFTPIDAYSSTLTAI